MERSKISWTDHTFNAWIGCSEAAFVSDDGREYEHQGCINCYAKAMAAFRGWAEWGPGKPRRVTGEDNWRKPYRWARQAVDAGKPALVFCMSLGDVLDVDAPKDAQIALWRVIADTSHALRWLFLTKRIGRQEIIPRVIRNACWIGTSISDQPSADALVPLLLASSGFAGRFLSVAPQVAPIIPRDGWLGKDAVFWVLQEGESGKAARPFDVEWARTWRDASRAAGVPYHLKQLGARIKWGKLSSGTSGSAMQSRAFGGIAHPTGGDPSEWPEDLRVQEFPEEFRR